MIKCLDKFRARFERSRDALVLNGGVACMNIPFSANPPFAKYLKTNLRRGRFKTLLAKRCRECGRTSPRIAEAHPSFYHCCHLCVVTDIAADSNSPVTRNGCSQC